MSQLDLSNAPEWATHYGPESDCYCEAWYQVVDGKIVKFSEASSATCVPQPANQGECFYHPIGELIALWTPAPKCDGNHGGPRCVDPGCWNDTVATPWTGEGLPPVGTVCEYYADEDTWRRCEIVAHKDGQAVVWVTNAHIWASSGGSLRPLRTPEQIAAEEREKAIGQMMADYEFTVGSCTHLLMRSQAERLHDAGYRKAGGGAQ